MDKIHSTTASDMLAAKPKLGKKEQNLFISKYILQKVHTISKIVSIFSPKLSFNYNPEPRHMNCLPFFVWSQEVHNAASEYVEKQAKQRSPAWVKLMVV